MARTAIPKTIEIDVPQLRRGEMTLWLVGETPLYYNRMASKAKRELLLPRGRLTATQRATKLKHAPFAEYRDSMYRTREPGETMLQMLGSAPKKAAAGAALRMPTSVSKAEINALVSVPDEFVPVWGIPRLDLSVVRMAGLSRTPDVRSRGRLDRWAMRVRYRWTEPMLNQTSLITLVLGSGMVCGVGDWRIEKGGDNGGFRVVLPQDVESDRELADIIAEGAYLAQAEAIKSPICSNSESEELLGWYLEELARRGIDPELEEPEDVEVDDPESTIFGAGQEHLIAPADDVSRLPIQDGEEVI
jgi:hypothetical protein